MNVLLVSVPRAAEMLSVSTRTIHRYCAIGVLKFTRIGRRKLLPVSSLLAFAERGIDVATLRRIKAQLVTK